MHRFEIDSSGTLIPAEGIYVQYDETVAPTYTMEKENEITVITEKDFNTAFENYSNAAVVNFADGASNTDK